MNHIQKINEIFSLLLNEKKFEEFGITKQAVYWKMGTSFFTMFDRLYENILDKNISYPIKVFLDTKNKTTEGGNEAYQLKLNNDNVTPCKVRGYVSKAAIHQYMRSITGFGLGVVEKKYKNLKEFVDLGGEIKLVSNIKNLLFSNNRINLIIDIIVSSLFNNIKYQRDIAYSILIEVLIYYKFDFSHLEEDNQIFSFNKSIGKRNNKSIKYASLVNQLELIKKDIYNQGTKATYNEIVNCVFSNYEKLESFINDIWEKYQNKLNNDNSSMVIDMQILEANLMNDIKRKRSEFKNNIFEDRKLKGLIKNKFDLYSDIVNEDNSSDSLLVKFNESEAAHIYEINAIKKELLEQIENDSIKKTLLNYAADPNNGIMMKMEYHRSFDKRQWFFDANGVMIIPEENKEYLLNVKQLKKIKIKKEIFNENMKSFLVKR